MVAVRRFALLSLGLCVLSGLASWFLLGRPWFMPVSVVVGQLEKLLPGLEQTQTNAYRNQSWCKNIAYSYGNFSDTEFPSTCNLFEGEANPFDETAKAAFNNLRRTLLLTGVNINFLNVYVEGETTWLADFSLGCWLCSRTRYVYEPGYVLQEDIPNEMSFNAVNENWYVVNEDWN